MQSSVVFWTAKIINESLIVQQCIILRHPNDDARNTYKQKCNGKIRQM